MQKKKPYERIKQKLKINLSYNKNFKELIHHDFTMTIDINRPPFPPPPPKTRLSEEFKKFQNNESKLRI